MEPSRCITVRPKPPPVNFQWKYNSREVLAKILNVYFMKKLAVYLIHHAVFNSKNNVNCYTKEDQ